MLLSFIIALCVGLCPVIPLENIHRVNLPLVTVAQNAIRVQTIPVTSPGIWAHVHFTRPDAHVQWNALVFNPAHPGGLWTRLEDARDGQWIEIVYRLTWSGWWQEQRVLEFRGVGYEIDTAPIPSEATP